MKRLLTLIEQNHSPFIFPFEYNRQHSVTVSRLGEAYMGIIKANYLEDIPHGDSLSASQLGKPGILLAWNKFMDSEVSQPSFALKRKWLGGHMFELEVMFWLERLGYSYEWQPNIKIFGSISGHPDFIVDGEEGRFIVECKHVGNSVYTAYQKGMYNQGYITQFALYCSHYECGGMWLVGNTDTGEMMTIVLPTYADVCKHYMSSVTDAMYKWTTVSKAESFDECIAEGISLPLPTNRNDGSHGIVPELYSGKGILHPVCQLYSIEYNEKLQPCVTGLNYPQHLRSYEPEWSP